MMINRRDFLKGLGLLAVAPAIVRFESLMPVRPIFHGNAILWGDGVHDDTFAMQTFINGGEVYSPEGKVITDLSYGSYKITNTLEFPGSFQWRSV